MASKEHNLISAIAYADAMGLPFETKTQEELEDLPFLDDFHPVSGHKYFLEDLPGTISDDTQQSMAVARSLMNERGFEYEDLVDHLIDEMKHSSKGWGTGTLKNLEAYQFGYRQVSQFSRLRRSEGGSGVIMRLAPLVFWQHRRGFSETESFQQIEQFTRITHNSDLSVILAFGHGLVLRDLLSGRISAENLPEDAASYFERAEENVAGVESGLPLRLSRLGEIATSQSSEEADVNTIENILNSPQHPFDGSDVLLTTYYAFMHQQEFASGLDRVIRLGGDTDSSAAVFAGMSVAAGGAQKWPPANIERLQRFEEIDALSRKFGKFLVGGVDG